MIEQYQPPFEIKNEPLRKTNGIFSNFLIEESVQREEPEKTQQVVEHYHQLPLIVSTLSPLGRERLILIGRERSQNALWQFYERNPHLHTPTQEEMQIAAQRRERLRDRMLARTSEVLVEFYERRSPYLETTTVEDMQQTAQRLELLEERMRKRTSGMFAEFYKRMS